MEFKRHTKLAFTWLGENVVCNSSRKLSLRDRPNLNKDAIHYSTPLGSLLCFVSLCDDWISSFFVVPGSPLNKDRKLSLHQIYSWFFALLESLLESYFLFSSSDPPSPCECGEPLNKYIIPTFGLSLKERTIHLFWCEAWVSKADSVIAW